MDRQTQRRTERKKKDWYLPQAWRKRRNKKEKLIGILVAALVTAAYFALVERQIGFSYAINDDINMRDIASGAFTGQPDAHLIFILYPVGLLLKELYTLWPQWEWYGIFMVGCHVLSMWTTMTAVLLERPVCLPADPGCGQMPYADGVYEGDFPDSGGYSGAGIWRRRLMKLLLFVLLYTILWLPQVVRVQFSTCAASLGAAALLWYGLGPGGAEGRTAGADVVTAVLAVLCLCVRIEVFCITGVFALLLFVWKEWDCLADRRHLLRALRLVALTVFFCLAAYMTDRQAYESEEWQQYLAFNQDRSNLYDYYELPAYETYRSGYEALGLSRDTVAALADANILADDQVNEETISRLCQWTGDVSRQGISFGRRLWNGLALAAGQFSASDYGYLCGLAVFFWLFFFRKLCAGPKRRLPCLLFGAAALLLQGAMWLYLGYGGRLPQRVGYCMHLCGLTAAISLCRSRNSWLKPEPDRVLPRFRTGVWRRCDRALLYGIALLLAWGSFARAEAEAAGRLEAQQMTELIETYCMDHPDRFYFADVYSLSAHTGRVKWKSFRAQDGAKRASNYMRMGDWTSFSPLSAKKMEDNGIVSVTESLVRDDSVYLITRDDNPLDYLKRFCAAQGERVAWHVTDVLNCGEFHMYVYQFTDQEDRMLDYRHFDKVQASVNQTEGPFAADGDSGTRWNSGIAQQAGMALDIVLDQCYTVTGFRLDLFFYEDHPQRLHIETSEDGEHWTVRQATSAGQVEFTFQEPVSCRNIRLILEEPESEEAWNWSVYEILVFVRP